MLLREVYDKSEYEIVYLKEFTPVQAKQNLEKALKDKWTALSGILSIHLKSKITTTHELEQADYEVRNYNVLDLRRPSMEIMFFLRHLIDDDERIIEPMTRLLSQAYRKNISENALLLYYTVNKMSCLRQRFSMQEDVEFTGKEAAAFQQCLTQSLPGKIDLKATRYLFFTYLWEFFKKISLFS